MNYQNKTRFSLIVLILFCALLCFAALEKMAGAQTCTLRTQGYTGGCTNVNVLWFTQTPQSQIERFDLNTFAGRFTALNSARSFSIPTSCSSGGQVVITEVRTNGTTCAAQYSGNLPHNRSCEQCAGVGGRLSTANSASFQPFLAADAIGTAFSDADLTTVTAFGFDSDPLTDGIQLPTEVGGVRALVGGVPAGLFFVSPRQINFHIPKDLPTGLHQMTVATQSGNTITGNVVINRNSPGIFTAEQNGSGQAMALWFHFRQGIFYRIYPVGSRFDLLTGDRIFLVMFGTGINSSRATLRINNHVYESAYAGNAPFFVGLDQLNFEVPIGELWNGSLGGQVTVWEPDGASWLSNGFSITGIPAR